jgi:hypothetical protein
MIASVSGEISWARRRPAPPGTSAAARRTTTWSLSVKDMRRCPASAPPSETVAETDARRHCCGLLRCCSVRRLNDRHLLSICDEQVSASGKRTGSAERPLSGLAVRHRAEKTRFRCRREARTNASYVEVARLRADEGIAEADTLSLTMPNQLGVDYTPMCLMPSSRTSHPRSAGAEAPPSIYPSTLRMNCVGSKLPKRP